MKNIQTKIAIALLTIGAALPLSSFSQAVMDHSKMNMSQMTPSLTDGEVKKIDLETGIRCALLGHSLGHVNNRAYHW